MANQLVKIGDRFGRWVVIGPRAKKNGRYHWPCVCDCGKESVVLQDNLRCGYTKSCGCLSRELAYARGKMRAGEGNPNWIGGRVLNRKGYIRLYMPDHPSSDTNGYITEHRLIAENVLGRPLKKTECVHHIDGDKTNNTYNNLVICNYALHQTLHKNTRRLHNV